MSLVNTMLKNLHNNSKQEKIAAPQGDLPSPQKNRRKRYIYFIVAIVIIALVIFLVPRRNKEQSSPSLATQSTDNAILSINNHQDQHNSTANQQPQQSTTSSADKIDTLPASNIDKTANSSQPQASTHSSKPNNDANTATHHSGDNVAVTDKSTTTQSLINKKSTSTPQTSQIEIKEPPLTKEQLLAKQYNQAMEQLHQQHQQQATQQLIAILQQDPDYKNARLSLAALLIQQKQTYRAERLLQTGLQQRPNDPDYAKLYAHLLVQRGATKQALELLNQAKPSHIENHVDYFALMASLSMQQQDYRNAEALYRLLVSQEPLNSTWWAGLGIAADKLGLSMEAHDAFTRANRIGNLPPPLQRYIDNTLRQ